MIRLNLVLVFDSLDVDVDASNFVELVMNPGVAYQICHSVQVYVY